MNASPRLSIALLLTLCLSLSIPLTSWFHRWEGNRAQSGGLLATVMGDSRRLFAKHFFARADAYFHNGYYPSIYDNRDAFQTPHLAAEAGAVEERNHGERDFLGAPRDWIDRFSRHFYPSRHTHLGDAGCGHSCCPDHARQHDHGHPHHHDHDEEAGQTFERPAGLEREILPWLRLSASLDPERVETYTTSAYWLCNVGKTVEAEQFLREGLRANPGNSEILFELGKIHRETHKDPERARNLWELALKNWEIAEAGKKEPNIFLFAQITGNLARLEEEQGRFPAAIDYLERLRKVSPNAVSIQQWIDELRAKLGRAQG